jgi:hypothetical protein
MQMHRTILEAAGVTITRLAQAQDIRGLAIYWAHWKRAANPRSSVRWRR